jgi:sortase (surface protein transpeptidase)
VPRLRLRTVVVEGTPLTSRAVPAITGTRPPPGAGSTVAVAGPPTTYLQPFRPIDHLRPGGHDYFETQYGTFRYVVYAQAIVDDRTGRSSVAGRSRGSPPVTPLLRLAPNRRLRARPAGAA